MSNLNDKPTDPVLFHTLTIDETLNRLDSGMDGLSEEFVVKQRYVFGKNELAEGKRVTIIEMFFEQFKNIMVIVLLIAAIISGVMGEITDTVIILAVVLINAVLGVVQESKAEKALEALKNMSKPSARVKRNGKILEVKSEEIVPGDIVLIEAGDFVPADIRLVECASLKIDEAALTGESVPSEKAADITIEPDAVIGDRNNMAYMSSNITYGRGTGVVTDTGMNTEVGKIAGYLANQDVQKTPLQKKLAEMSKYLSFGIIIISIFIFLVGVLQGREYFEMFLTAVSLAVAAIPEGLLAIITIVLAIGVQKMSKRNAIIRKLPAVETLGSTEIICSDKTGTLTQNKMTVKEIYVDGKIVNSEDFLGHEKGFEIFLQVASLCNDSKITNINDNGEVDVLGDPTETALVTFAHQKGFDKDVNEKSIPRKAEIPFDSDRKLMSTINQLNGRYRVMTKGAPDILLEKCSKILVGNKIEQFTEKHMEQVKKTNSHMAGKALRTLALAFKDIDEIPQNIISQNVENDLVFIGLIGMIDPPRQEVKDAVHICREAGIRPIMITGDHRDTAAAIARELNIIENESEIITGKELDKISQQDFAKQVVKYSVYARVSPQHKVRIVEAWKKRGKIVAMTGDGVNDAPALKASDIGVGMGITGTDVAKGVSDIVLSDDNFATIVAAVKEGRKVYSNIRKSIQFLLSANMGEVLTLFVATLLNWTILFPIHILWINLVTDVFPALALGVEKSERDIMKQKPRVSSAGFFSDRLGFNIVYQGILEGIITLATYYTGLINYSQDTAITMAFVTLGLIQLTHCLNVRSSSKSIFKIGIFTNMYLIGAIAISGLLQLIVVVVPCLNKIFRLSQLNMEQWLIVIGASVLIIPIVEIVKLLQNKNTR